MRHLIPMLCLPLLAILVAPALGGNVQPRLFLEVYRFEEQPVPVPDYVCVHAIPPYSAFPCFAVRMPYNLYYVPIHVGALNPPCPLEPGPACADYGGFVGVPFGIVQSAPEGTPLTFVSWNACPGFLEGVSVAGEPAACVSNSTSGCKDWYDHPGYLVYVNASSNSTKAAMLYLVPNADLGHNKVVNCAFAYDENTYAAGMAEINDTQTTACFVPVEENTWGSIKALFR